MIETPPSSIPYYDVGLREAIEQGDKLIERAFGGVPVEPLSSWIEAENQRRKDEREAFERATIEVDGVTVAPGDVVHVTEKSGWHGSRPRRHLNCVFLGRLVHRQSYSGPSVSLRFMQYGGSNTGWPKAYNASERYVVKVEKVEKVPAFVSEGEARRRKDG